MVRIPFERSEPFTTTSSARTKFLLNFRCEIPWCKNPLSFSPMSPMIVRLFSLTEIVKSSSLKPATANSIRKVSYTLPLRIL